MTLVVRAPFTAHVTPLSEVPDPVFASGVVGDGCALLPLVATECLTVHAPVNGVVTKLKPHAAIVTSTSGVSILIHLGIDTVSLHGLGFAALVQEGDVVAAGDPLIHWDLTPVRDAGLSPCVPLIAVSPPGTAVSRPNSDVRRSLLGRSSMKTSSPSESHRGTHQLGYWSAPVPGMFCGRTSPTASTSEATMSLEGTFPT